MIEGFDTNAIFVLSRPVDERRELLELLVVPNAADIITIWFKQRGRELTAVEAQNFISIAVNMAHTPLNEISLNSPPLKLPEPNASS